MTLPLGVDFFLRFALEHVTTLPQVGQLYSIHTRFDFYLTGFSAPIEIIIQLNLYSMKKMWEKYLEFVKIQCYIYKYMKKGKKTYSSILLEEQKVIYKLEQFFMAKIGESPVNMILQGSSIEIRLL